MLRRRSRHRLSTALLTLVAMLFAQVALANYACPGSLDLAMASEMAASGEPCDGMDTVQPVLCHQQAASTAQSIEVPAVSLSLPAVVQMTVVVPVVDVADLLGMRLGRRRGGVETRPPPDPLFLSTLRLRV